MKAPFGYYGGKTRIAPTIVDLLPPHEVYLEPFMGSCAVFFEKKRSRHEILNDLNGDLVTFFRVLRDQPDALERACRLTPYSRAEYASAVSVDTAVDTLPDIERARLWWVMVTQSFGRTARRNSGWSRTLAQNYSAPMTNFNRFARFEECAARLAEAMLECKPALELIAELGASNRADDTVIYVDPPYLADTRRTLPSSSYSSSGKDYEMDMGRSEDHVALAEVLTSTAAKVLLSGYPSPLYDELYAGWDHHEIVVNAYAGQWTKQTNKRTEVLWSNYKLDIPRQLELA